MRRVLAPLLVVLITAHLCAQTRFDVVSVKRSAPTTAPFGNSSMTERPDGGFTRMNWYVSTLIAEAYALATRNDIVGLPEWATKEGYDIKATSALPRATQTERAAMKRALLADRFKLAAHLEKRPQDVYDLVLSRRDGKLGAGLSQIDTDCDRVRDERASDPPTAPSSGRPPDFNAPLPPCTYRVISAGLIGRSGAGPPASGDLLEGSGTIDDLATALRLANLGRRVVNRTNLTGSFSFRMYASMMSRPLLAGIAPASDTGQTVFSALQEQLGLKLQSARADIDTLIVDHLERPTED